ncbi:SUN domain-containing protein 3-like [Ctenocephalides felis]|uniref:SUN domain-containing protein 3-like n=1 Tax=Ctenocephalides felis TaxID=7515 RepID=UPI000E6E1F62|nr:SUN domain-containing protein 3-like [Ctenocephalides felis]
MDNLDEGLHRHTNLGNKKSLAWKAETDNNTKSYEGYWFIKYFIGIPISFDKASQIDSLLTPWKNPGDCWAFKGSKGQAIITLQNPAKLSHVTMEHIVSDRNSAPYEHEVHGIRFNKSIWLGSYFYDKTGSNIQTNKLIHVEPEYLYKKVVLTIKSNHGNPDYTCVYRFRIHGFTE